MFTVKRVPSAHVLPNMFEKGLFPACAVFNTVQHTCSVLFWTDEVKKDELVTWSYDYKKCCLWVYLDLAGTSAVLVGFRPTLITVIRSHLQALEVVSGLYLELFPKLVKRRSCRKNNTCLYFVST